MNLQRRFFLLRMINPKEDLPPDVTPEHWDLVTALLEQNMDPVDLPETKDPVQMAVYATFNESKRFDMTPLGFINALRLNIIVEERKKEQQELEKEKKARGKRLKELEDDVYQLKTTLEKLTDALKVIISD